MSDDDLEIPMITLNLITLNLEAKGAFFAIEELVTLVDKEERLTSFGGFMDDIIAREQQVSTEVGWGVSLPHSRSLFVNSPTICVGRSSDGFFWKEDSQEKTHLVYLLAAPKVVTNAKYMRVLASLARELLEPDFRNRCLAAKDREEMYDTITKTIFNGNLNQIGKE